MAAFAENAVPTFYMDDPAGFNTAVSSLTFKGLEDFESSTSAPNMVQQFDDPLAPGIPNSVFPAGTNPAIGLTLQSNDLGQNPTIPDPHGTNGLVTASQGFLGTPTDQVGNTFEADSLDLIFSLPGGEVVKAVSFIPLFFDDVGIDPTDTLTVRVYDPANNFLGSSTIVGGDYVAADSFVGVVAAVGDSIGRINLVESSPANDFVGVDDVRVYSSLSVDVTATKTDTLVDDVNNNTLVDPGDTLEYTTEISNNGDENALGTTFTDITDDTEVTVVPGSLTATPIGVNDAYNVIGNTQITLPAATGLLANDIDPDGGSLTASCAPCTTTQGATVTLNSDGSFSYTPPASYTGADTFVYTVTDNDTLTDTGTVTFNISNLIWWVDSDEPAGGTGTSTSPFNSLTPINAAGGAGDADSTNDIIFVYDRGVNYAAGLPLEDNQRLCGHGANLQTCSGLTPPTGTTFPAVSTNPTILNAGGDGITLANNNTIHGVNVGNSSADGIAGANFGTLNLQTVAVNTSGRALNLATGTLNAAFTSVTSTGGANNISLTSVLGTLTLGTGALSGSSSHAFLVNGGTAAISYAGTVTNSTADAVNIQNKTGGTVTLSGAVASTGTGITLVNNGGATINLTGGLVVTTSSNEAFTATGGGTVSVTGSSNTINATNATALNVTNTTIGAGGLDFLSISSSGAARGITLNNTGTSGGLTVTGTGTTDGSGGTISNITQRGIELITTRNVSLANMTLTNANTANGAVSNGTLGGNENTDENGAIHLQSAVNVNLTNVDINGATQHGINGNTVTNLDISNSVIQNTGNAVWESGIYIFHLFGLPSASADNVFNNITVQDTGQFNVFVQNGSPTNPSPGEMDRLTFSSSTFNDSGNSVAGDHITVANRNNANFHTVVTNSTFTAVIGQTSDSIQIDAGNTSHSDIDISGSSFSNGNIAINISGSGTSVSTFEVENNPSVTNRAGNTVNIASNASASLEGHITNNTISTVVANNAGSGIDIVVDQTGSAVVDINTNTITGQSTGIRAGARNAGTGTADVTIRNNTVTTTGNSFPFSGVWLFAGNGSAGETNNVCINFSANTIDTTSPFGDPDYFLEQYTGNAFRLQGLVPPAGATEAQVEAFIAATDQDPSPADPTVEAAGGLIVNYTAGTCAVPSLSLNKSDTNDAEESGILNERPKTAVSESALTGAPASDALFDKMLLLSAAGENTAKSSMSDEENAQAEEPAQALLATTVVGPFTLPPGESTTITFQVVVNDPFPAANNPICNQATISGSNFSDVLTDDPDVGGSSDPTCTTVEINADLAIIKTDGTATAVPGQPHSYTIVASNAGPNPDPAAVVTDNFPAALTGVTWTCVGAGGASCTGAGSGNINETVNLPVGGSVTFTVNGTIDPGATGTLTNTADVATSTGITDPTLGNNSATDNTTLTPQADVSITKTDGQTTDIPGTSIVYTIVAANAGPSNAPSVTIADTFPADLTGVTWTCVGAGGGSCTAAGAGNINDVVNLPAGGSVTYTVNATIDASATGILSNTATATVGGGVTDPTPGNNSATDTTTLTPQADVSITKTDGQTTDVPGTTIVYTIVAANAGPSDAPSVTVADTFPATLTGVTWTCVGVGGGSCTAAGAGNINDVVNLPAGGSVTYTVNATIAASATGILSNTATVTVGGGVTDPTPGNNSATDTTTLTPQADLSITKTDGQATAVPGQTVTYTIVAANAGPSNDPTAAIADTFPAILTGVTWTCVGAGGATCTAAGAGDINDTANLPAGGSVTYTASGTINADATGSLVNTATVTSSITDPTPGNNSATDTDTLTPTADLSITKTDGQATAVPGTSITFTIVAANAGPSDAPGATVADTFPAILTGVTWTCVGAGGATCTAAGAGNINDIVNLPAGGSVTYTANAVIDAGATGTLVNTATVAAPGGVTDPTPGNNSATDTNTLTPTADLSITKTDGLTVANPGQATTYTITVSSAGPSTAVNATVADTFSADLTGVTWTCAAVGGATCTAAGAGDINDSVTLPSGSSLTYIVNATIDAGATGTLVNTATITAPGGVTDPVPGNNSATDNTSLDAPPVITNFTVTPSAINENDTVDLSVTFTDPNTPEPHEVVIDWGDGISETINLPIGVLTASADHQYLDDNPTATPSDDYTVTVTVNEPDGGTDSDTAVVTVNNVAPVLSGLNATTIDENGATTLSGTITDPGTLDTFTLTVDWGDGSAPEQFNYPAGTTNFNETHTYLDDDPTGTPSDDISISLTLTDDDTGSDTDSAIVTVSNVAPTLSNITANSPINENEVVTVTGTINDPGTLDTFTLAVDWGDGSAPELFNYAAGTTSFNETHTYLDDNPTGTPSDVNTIALTLTDDDTGTDTAAPTVTVNNLPPALSNVMATPLITETDFITVTGSIVEVGTQDTLTLTVDWADGNVETFTYPAGTTSFLETHQYLDGLDWLVPLADFPIDLTLEDDDTGSFTTSITVTVNNQAPTLSNVTFPATLDEGDTAMLTGNINEISPLDTFTLLVDWGDGITETFNYPAAATAFTETHSYPDDDPSGTPSDTHTVILVLSDDNGGSDVLTTSVTVNNVAPALNNIVIPAVNENEAATLTADLVDPGILDTFDVAIDWGDGNIEMFSYGAGTTAITESHVYLDDDPTGTPSDNYTVILSIVDDDTGAGSATGSVTVNNVAPVVNAGPDQVVQISTPVNFNGAITDTGTLDTHEIVWDLGDGTIVTGTLTPSHLYSSEGTYIVTLTVTDDDTGVGTDTMQVVVDSPTAVTLTDLGGSSSSRPTLLYFFLLLPGVAVWLFYRRYVKA
jgi:uncharacterized repeat protein (TIGR01451 family)